MNRSNRTRNNISILWLELLMFGLVLITLWMDEFIDLPHRLFNAPPTPYRIEEYIIETASIGIIAIVTMLLTRLLMKRLEHAEEFVRVCSWCKRVFLHDRWVRFEEYLLQKQDLSSTHGICESCARKVRTKISETKGGGSSIESI